MKLVICADSKFKAVGLQQALLNEGYEIMAVCTSREDSIKEALIQQPDKVVCAMSHEDNIHIAKVTKLPMIFVSDDWNDNKILTSQEVNASMAFEQELISAVNSVNVPYISEQITPFENIKETKKLLLTARELEVVSCIAQGMSNSEIAQTLFITDKTVKNHLTSILRKTNCTDRTQVLIQCLKKKLVTL